MSDTGARNAVRDDPFARLGLAARADLSDDDVRAAWRRVAAATHPDRDDGGDPAWFGAAAAAYAMLRTRDGRGEALADLPAGARARGGWPPGRARRVRGLGLRLLVAIAIIGVAFAAAGRSPASLGVLAGALTWLTATARHDLGSRG